MNTAVIVAGGSGTRMKADVRKQYLVLKGLPVLRRTLEVFSACSAIDRICLVVPEDDVLYCREQIVEQPTVLNNIYVTSGGDERQQSVFNGLSFFNDFAGDDIVVIHDGVRPFVSGCEIKASVTAAIKYGAAIIAIPAFDTIKQSGKDDFIEKTLQREKIWLAQTPQTFQYNVIHKAHLDAIETGIQGTDDASLVELTGIKVKLIEGQRNNLKITTSEDLKLADSLIDS